MLNRPEDIVALVVVTLLYGAVLVGWIRRRRNKRLSFDEAFYQVACIKCAGASTLPNGDTCEVCAGSGRARVFTSYTHITLLDGVTFTGQEINSLYSLQARLNTRAVLSLSRKDSAHDYSGHSRQDQQARQADHEPS